MEGLLDATRSTVDSFLRQRGARQHAGVSDYAIAKLHKPVDRTEWDMTPQTYNAYYNPSNNEIVLPAAMFILPGIADSLVDDAIVYAYAGGTTIGHEITHGFDDEGRQFDEKGNLAELVDASRRDGVQPARAEDRQAVRRSTSRSAPARERQATQGENIADLGGISSAGTRSRRPTSTSVA